MSMSTHDDVIELRAVEPRQAFGDAKGAREHAIGRVNDDLSAEPEEGGRVIEVDDRTCSEKGEDRPRGCVKVSDPGNHAALLTNPGVRCLGP